MAQIQAPFLEGKKDSIKETRSYSPLVVNSYDTSLACRLSNADKASPFLPSFLCNYRVQVKCFPPGVAAVKQDTVTGRKGLPIHLIDGFPRVIGRGARIIIVSSVRNIVGVAGNAIDRANGVAGITVGGWRFILLFESVLGICYCMQFYIYER